MRFPHAKGLPMDIAAARAQWQAEQNKLGRFNLAVFGKTGVGKSTLINAIFGEEVAATGIGRPVTAGSRLYLTRAGTLGLYDTRGLEIGSAEQDMLAEVTRFVESARTRDASEHIHVAYYCIRAGDHRIEDTEQRFIRGLHGLGIPVFLVMTQVHRRNGVLRAEHLQFAEYLHGLGMPIHAGHPYLTAALPDAQLGYEAFGLTDLLAATDATAPEATRVALATAQVIDRSLKRKAVKARIASAVATASTVGASPVPFSDAALLVPIQTAMMASIAQVYRIPMSAALVASLAATAAATQAGRAAATGLLKMLPGVNLVVSGVSAAIAGAFTMALGRAWARVCEMIVDGRFGPMDNLDESALKDAFLSEFKQRFTSSLDDLGRQQGDGR